MLSIRSIKRWKPWKNFAPESAAIKIFLILIFVVLLGWVIKIKESVAYHRFDILSVQWLSKNEVWNRMTIKVRLFVFFLLSDSFPSLISHSSSITVTNGTKKKKCPVFTCAINIIKWLLATCVSLVTYGFAKKRRFYNNRLNCS